MLNMKNKISIYTKTGDKGETTRFGGEKLSKSETLFECLGDIDELNCAIGIAKEHSTTPSLTETLVKIQNQLFNIGAYISSPEKNKLPTPVDGAALKTLEELIDVCEEKNSPLTTFILPGGGILSAHIHLARSICRRAERKVVMLSNEESLDPLILSFINRLSDYLFVLARHCSINETLWQK